MTDLVSVADARAHLRLDSTADDAWLAIFIPAISDAVSRWLKDWWRLYVTELDENNDPVLDSSGDQVPVVDTSGHYEVKPVVRAAVLVELASQYRFREGDESQQRTGDLYSGRYGYILCTAATNLLQAVRKTTVR